MDWLLWLERSPLPTWVRESGSIWSYPTILTMHTLGLGVLVGANAVVDIRVLGFASAFPISSVRSLGPPMAVGLVLNVVTGVLLFAADATTKSGQTVFFVKLGCIALALLAMSRVMRLVGRATGDGALAGTAARGWAVLSLTSWLAAIVAGRLMAYV